MLRKCGGGAVTFDGRADVVQQAVVVDDETEFRSFTDLHLREPECFPDGCSATEILEPGIDSLESFLNITATLRQFDS